MTWPDPPPPRLHVRSAEVATDVPLLDLLPAADSFAWLRRGEGMVAWGEAVRYKAASIADADQWWRDLTAATILESGASSADLVAFGCFVFDPAATAAQSMLIVPEALVRRVNGRTWLTTIAYDEAPAPDLPLRRPEPPVPPRGVRFNEGALSSGEWAEAVAEAVRRINAGVLDKVVLARDVVAAAETDIDARWLVARLASDYPRCWTYLIDGLVGSTPEMLVRREAGLATSRVLAGTIRRSGDGRRDLALAAALAESSKDLEEHEYAVRSVAAALAPYCSGMHVPDAPYVLDLPNVLHLATDVTGVADPATTALGLAAALHPSAAVCGTPTEVARAVIAELEQLDRERYAGPVGWIDGHGDGEWAIALRCGQLFTADPRHMRLYAGCGVVAGSDPRAELAEAAAKLVPMRSALIG